MTQQTIEIRVLTASEGMLLTNGDTTSTMVYLGVNDSPDNWWEIPDTEAGSVDESGEQSFPPPISEL